MSTVDDPPAAQSHRPAGPAASNGWADNDVRGWIDSGMKIQLLAFFRDNPGVIETSAGLARRLGLNEKHLTDEIQDHVRVGILKARSVGSRTIYLYNRNSDRDLAARLQAAIEGRMQGGPTQ